MDTLLFNDVHMVDAWTVWNSCTHLLTPLAVTLRFWCLRSFLSWTPNYCTKLSPSIDNPSNCGLIHIWTISYCPATPFSSFMQINKSFLQDMSHISRCFLWIQNLYIWPFLSLVSKYLSLVNFTWCSHTFFNPHGDSLNVINKQSLCIEMKIRTNFETNFYRN